jgi:thiamine kinase-like enzyme
MRYLINAVRETYQLDVEKHQAFGWTVERKASGMNGLIFRVQSDDDRLLPYAVKISMRDERQRTIREFGAMTALITMGLRHIVPFPLLFFEEPDGLPGDVLVMEWLEGAALQAAPTPENKALWRAILITFADVHSVMYSSQIKLFQSMMSIKHPRDLLELIRERRYRLPQTGQIGCITAEALDNLLAKIAQKIPLQWDNEPALCLTLCDANPTNMIVDRGEVRFVDWANSGWSDGAFDIADMLAQPSYIHLPEEHRIWIRKTYANMVKDKQAVERIQVYERMMYFFWTCGMSQPLVGASPKRMAGVKEYPLEHYEKYQQLYWELANDAY